jgi:hypothetical protein
VGAAEATIVRAAAVQHSVRYTPDRQHVAVTLEVSVVSADEVMAVYRSLQPLEGLKFLL